MALGQLAPRSRRVLRWHGWLLLAWVTLVGAATWWALRRGLGVDAKAARYALSAGSIYFFGFVVGGWAYARWWVKSHSHDFAHATPEERLAYEREQEEARKEIPSVDLPTFELGDDPISALIAILVLLVFSFTLLYVVGLVPAMLTELLAGYLAEIVLEFVAGALLVRRAAQPRPLEEYWSFALRRTLLPGLLVMAVAGAIGYALQG
jgi:hypothetical protein